VSVVQWRCYRHVAKAVAQVPPACRGRNAGVRSSYAARYQPRYGVVRKKVKRTKAVQVNAAYAGKVGRKKTGAVGNAVPRAVPF